MSQPVHDKDRTGQSVKQHGRTSLRRLGGNSPSRSPALARSHPLSARVPAGGQIRLSVCRRHPLPQVIQHLLGRLRLNLGWRVLAERPVGVESLGLNDKVVEE
jgi:hypothetical protein